VPGRIDQSARRIQHDEQAHAGSAGDPCVSGSAGFGAGQFSPILAVGLGTVEGVIGLRDDLDQRVSVLRINGQSGAGRDDGMNARIGFGEDVDNAQGSFDDQCGLRVAKEYQKFIATDSRRDIGAANGIR